jgi:S-adenosylmethionine:tRNA ribosyltransferase-isomerase
LKLADFEFHLPEELIAQRPLADRAASRMLVVERKSGRWRDRMFRDLPEYIEAGDCVVVNNTKVFPARLFGRRAGVHTTTSKDQLTGLVEVLLVRQAAAEPMRWEALVRPGRKIRLGERVQFPGGLEGEVVERGEFGLRTIEFPDRDGFWETVERIGHMPLPPYVKRSDDRLDRERYQTVYARHKGSVAAPTAGLHFTPEIFDQIARRGGKKVEITLHVGLGTFQPVRAENIEDHAMHGEQYEIGEQAAGEIRAAKRVLAVGTTAVRTLEHAGREGRQRLAASRGDTAIFIYPGHEFQVVDAMLTNFHLPASTLLMLVSAFAGRELMLDAYAHAVREKYRFYSYGDCMLIV